MARFTPKIDTCKAQWEANKAYRTEEQNKASEVYWAQVEAKPNQGKPFMTPFSEPMISEKGVEWQPNITTKANAKGVLSSVRLTYRPFESFPTEELDGIINSLLEHRKMLHAAGVKTSR